jgi:hypothetical protein
MINYITQNEFIDTFKKVRPDNFSYEGLEVLFEHLEMVEDSLDKPLVFDVIAICCDYTEYDNEKELLESYNMTIQEIQDNTFCFEEFYKTGSKEKSYIVGNF